MKNVLLIAPDWVGLHQDIIKGLEDLGCRVEFIPEYSFKGDPSRVKKQRYILTCEKADLIKTTYWKENLEKTNTIFDYLLVIDGQGVNHFLFTELKKRNADIQCVNYLYDTTYSYYHFEESFHFYDKIYSFDKKDSQKHGIGFLPIYWVNCTPKDNIEKYEIFGFGAYSANRFKFYQFMRSIAEDLKKSYFIKLYAPPIKHFQVYRVIDAIKPLFGLKRFIPFKIYRSDYITNKLMSTDEFRSHVNTSDIILDTKVNAQDGLTARFMWALGAGKKIITTNDAVIDYDFYDPQQILVLNDNEFSKQDKINVKSFMYGRFSPTDESLRNIECYRIDNWLKSLLYF